MNIRNIGKKLFGEGGQMSQGLFSPLMFETMKPIVQQAYNVKDYVKEAKDSEQNQLKAFAEMKASQALMTDQQKAAELHQGYTSAFDQASTQLNNPFSLSRFAQKQAIDYVNNPLRKNIEESSANYENSQKLQASDPKGDALAGAGNLAIEEMRHRKQNGTTNNRSSILRLVPPTKQLDGQEILQKMDQVVSKMDAKTLSTYFPNAIQGEDFVITKNAQKEFTPLAKRKAAAEIAINQSPEVIRNTEGNAFEEIYQNQLQSGMGSEDAKEVAYANYKSLAASKRKSLYDNLVIGTNINRESSAYGVNQTSHPTGGAGKENVQFAKKMDTKQILVDPLEEKKATKEGTNKLLKFLQGQNPTNTYDYPKIEAKRDALLTKINEGNLTLGDIYSIATGSSVGSADVVGVGTTTPTAEIDASFQKEMEALNKMLPPTMQIDPKNLKDINLPTKIKQAYNNVKSMQHINTGYDVNNLPQDVLEKINTSIASTSIKGSDGKKVDLKESPKWTTTVKIKDGRVLGQVTYKDADGIIQEGWVEMGSDYQPQNNSHTRKALRAIEHLQTTGYGTKTKENLGFDSSGNVGFRSGVYEDVETANGFVKQEIIVPISEMINLALTTDYTEGSKTRGSQSQYAGKKERPLFTGEELIQ
jgi:hypothetical protein